MSQHLDDALRAAMHTATRDVELSGDLISDVIHGGRRRVQRRILGAGVVTVVIVAAMAVPVTVLRAGDEASHRTPATGGTPNLPMPAAGNGDPFNWPTRGSLADNVELRAETLAAWLNPADRRGGGGIAGFAPSVQPDGEPRLLWLEQTSTGPAAVVAQDFPPQAAYRTNLTAVGVLLPGRGGRLQLNLEDVRYHLHGNAEGGNTDPDALAFVLGKETPQLVVVPAQPTATVSVSTRHRMDGSGKVQRNFRPAPLNGGVASMALPAGVLDELVEVRTSGRLVYRGPATLYSRDLRPRKSTNQMLTGPLPGVRGSLTGCHPGCWAGLGPQPALESSDIWSSWASRHGATAERVLMTEWAVHAVTRDRTRVFGSQVFLQGDPARTVVAILGPGEQVQIVYDEVVDSDAALPVKVKLPRGQGWLVVAHDGAKLRWKQPGGSWHGSADAEAATQLAALVPATPGVVVQVTYEGSTSEVSIN